nr:protein kinase superfamily protein [Tanacetum cinerariifolium]
MRSQRQVKVSLRFNNHVVKNLSKKRVDDGSDWFVEKSMVRIGVVLEEIREKDDEIDPSLLRIKRKGMKLEPKTYIIGLHCCRELPEGVKFVNNLVIKQLEHGLFFMDAFGQEAFQRVDEVHKVETQTLLGYKVMALNVKSDAN